MWTKWAAVLALPLVGAAPMNAGRGTAAVGAPLKQSAMRVVDVGVDGVGAVAGDALGGQVIDSEGDYGDGSDQLPIANGGSVNSEFFCCVPQFRWPAPRVAPLPCVMERGDEPPARLCNDRRMRTVCIAAWDWLDVCRPDPEERYQPGGCACARRTADLTENTLVNLLGCRDQARLSQRGWRVIAVQNCATCAGATCAPVACALTLLPFKLILGCPLTAAYAFGLFVLSFSPMPNCAGEIEP